MFVFISFNRTWLFYLQLQQNLSVLHILDDIEHSNRKINKLTKLETEPFSPLPVKCGQQFEVTSVFDWPWIVLTFTSSMQF